MTKLQRVQQNYSKLQGAPDLPDGNSWSYGEAQVRFQGETVVSWKNDIKNTLLAVEIEPPDEIDEPEHNEELDANEWNSYDLEININFPLHHHMLPSKFIAW